MQTKKLMSTGIKKLRKVERTEKTDNPSKMLLATSLAHFLNDASVALVPAVLPLLIMEFRLNYTEAGIIISISTLLMTSLQAIAGYVADRTNRTVALFLGLVTLGIGTILTSFSYNYVQLIIFQCLMGVGASAYHPIGYSLLSDAFELKMRGRAFGTVSAAGDLAVPVSFVLSSFLVSSLGWRNLFVIWGIFTVFAAIILLTLTKTEKGCLNRLNVRNRSAKKTVRALIPIITSMGLVGGCYKILFSFTPTYLTTFKLDIVSADMITASMLILAAGGSFIGGISADKIGERKTIFISMIMLGALSAILANLHVYLPFLICTIGFPLLCPWPSFYSLIAKTSNLGTRASAYGSLFAISWSFSSLLPLISGAFADIFGLYTIYLFVSILSILSALTAYFTLEEQRNG